MKMAYLSVPFLLLISAAAAQETTTFQWKPVLDPKSKIGIRGIPYAPEFALHDWNIQRATDAATDVTRFELRPGDQWDEDRDSGENKERSELDGYGKRFAHGTDIWGSYAFFIEPAQNIALTGLHRPDARIEVQDVSYAFRGREVHHLY